MFDAVEYSPKTTATRRIHHAHGQVNSPGHVRSDISFDKSLRLKFLCAPSAIAQARTSFKPKAVVSGTLRSPWRLTNALASFECGRFSPPLLASKNLRPTDSMAS